MQWISSSPLNFGIGVRSQLAAILLSCIRFDLFFLYEIGAILIIDNNINCDKCVFNISLLLMLTFIFMHSFVKFLFSSDNKTKLLKIQLQLNFGKPLLEQCSYQNVS